MGSFRKLDSGKWQAQIAKRGIRKSASFATKAEAKDWAARQEYLAQNEQPEQSSVSFSEVLERYLRDVSPTKKSLNLELKKIKMFKRHPIAQKSIRELRPADFAAWRDERLKQVAPATVTREMTIMSSVMNTARREWGLIEQNPLTDVRTPPSPPPRDRRVSAAELVLLRDAAGNDLQRKTARTFHAFCFAIETAMRLGEICGLTKDDLDLSSRVATLPMTKNGTMRKVPLSSAAIALIEELPPNDAVFNLEMENASALFRKLRRKVGINDLTFHDSRHEAITRLARKLDVLSLARMVGHKDIRMLQIYYNETAEELAKRLD